MDVEEVYEWWCEVNDARPYAPGSSWRLDDGYWSDALAIYRKFCQD